MSTELKNNGKGTFFGNLLRGIAKTGKTVAPKLINAITGGKVSDIIEAITGDTELTEIEKQMLVKELEQDVIEMQEVSKRWSSDMNSDSWLSKNIRPLSLAFLTLSLFIYVILDSSLEGFKIDSEWISLLGNLLLLVYAGYFGGRSLEKIRKK
ncbi:hypothetical protein N9824_00350 [bacterium]|nr:hypothetical protein [bacterium]